ncbi:MAG TPA: alpha/beta hydrolase [Lapillicoccus sp.]
MAYEHRSHRVSGGTGVALHVDETGNHEGRPVLFVHGFSQCRLAWNRQLGSGLGRDLRLVAMDLRGHGLSEKPRDDYGDPSVWADDLHAVVTELGMERPILCGWSYGGVVVADYLRRHGERAVSGIVLVGAVSRLGEPVMPFLGEGFVATLPGMFSTDVETSTTAVQTFLRLTTRADPTPEDFYLALGYNSAVPPHVRQAMMSRTLDHDDLLEQLTIPVLITHGLDDAIVLPTMSEYHARLIPHAKTSYYEGVGHTPFQEDPDRFNAELGAFASSL